MKKKIYTRPVSVTLPEEMFDHIKAVTDQWDIGFSDYIREAIKDKLETSNKNKIHKKCFRR